MIELHPSAIQYALTLPETTCSQPFGSGCDVFKIMDKVFMLSFYLGAKAVINLKVEPDYGIMLRDTYPYIHAGWHMNKKHWISIYEHSDVDYALLHALILNSYELVISKLNKVQQKRISLLRAAHSSHTH